MDDNTAIETFVSFDEGPVNEETECRDKSYEHSFKRLYLTCDEYISMKHLN